MPFLHFLCFRHFSCVAWWRTVRIAIVGGGFTGAVAAIHLLRRLEEHAEIVVYEPSLQLGHGIAYARSPDHFLVNVPAHGLAFSSNGHGDLLDWAQRNYTDTTHFREDDGSYYFPRSWFGRYVEATLNEARAIASSRIRFTHVQAVVNGMALSPAGVEISSRGETAIFDHAILSIGNAPSRPLAVDATARNCPKVVQSAWALPEAEIDRDSQVIIVGSGLTMAT